MVRKPRPIPLAREPVALAAAVAFSLVALALGGCGATPKDSDAQSQTQQGPVFIPEAPAPPRLQFLVSFRHPNIGSGSTASKPKGSLAQWIVGDEDGGKPKKFKFSSPYGTALRNGVLYVCDVGNGRVHVMDFNTGQYKAIGQQRFSVPVNIAIDADGTKYVADTGRRRVFVLDASDNYVREFAMPGDGSPIDVLIHGDTLFVCDVTGGCVHLTDKAGNVQRSIGKFGYGPDEMRNPTNIDIGPDNRLYVSDTFQQMIKVFDLEGRFLGAIGGPGAEIGRFARPKGIAVDPAGSVYVSDSQWDVVQVFNQQGKLLLVFGAPGSAPYSMGMPAGLCIDKTSLNAFRKYIDPSFDPEYLLVVVNQFGINKVALYAYGKSRSVPAEAYQVNPNPAKPEPAPGTIVAPNAQLEQKE